MASLLERLFNQCTIEIHEKEAEIRGLRLQQRQLEDADKKKELEQDVQALEGQRDKLVDMRMGLLQGASGLSQLDAFLQALCAACLTHCSYCGRNTVNHEVLVM